MKFDLNIETVKQIDKLNTDSTYSRFMVKFNTPVGPFPKLVYVPIPAVSTEEAD